MDKYYLDNKDRFSEYRANYRKDRKEQIEKIKQIWYENNKEKILKRNRELSYICECGKSVSHNHKARHEKTAKHKHYLENRLHSIIEQGMTIINKLNKHFNKSA